MWSTLLPGLLAGATLGALLGYFKFRSPIAGAVVGACLGAVVCHFLIVGPKSTRAVETPDEFDRHVLSVDGPVLVDFYADRCPPCRKLAPTIEALAEEYRGRVAVVKINVDRGGGLAARYGIRSIPTVIVFVKGEPVQQMTGCRPPEHFRQVLNAVLANQQAGAAGAPPAGETN